VTAAISQSELAIIRLALDNRAVNLRREARSHANSGPQYTRFRAALREEANRCEQIRAGLLQLGPGDLILVQPPRGAK